MSAVDTEQYKVKQEPFYKPVANEVELYEAAYSARMPMMLKGPTGCGKSRFVEYMAWKLGRPLITVACNEDMTASDLVGRFLLDKEGTKWQDGPLTTAARIGAICYLDEVVEARQDTTVVIHPLTDHRRTLPLDKKGELIEAHKDFQLVISYNPGYQSLMKDLKQSTKQRFGALDFDYPEEKIETDIVAQESGVDKDIAGQAGADRAPRPQPEGPRPGRGHLHPPAGVLRPADRQGRRTECRLHHDHGHAADRRSGHARHPERRGTDVLWLSGRCCLNRQDAKAAKKDRGTAKAPRKHLFMKILGALAPWRLKHGL
jgi:nitric oxide reductase NorQ protein